MHAAPPLLATPRGCYADAEDRVWGSRATSLDESPLMTVDRCARRAANAGLKYVGLQFGSQCWSGNDYAQIVSLGESTQCTMTCAGDTNTICGGPWASNLFELSRA
jgi:hypothetical protein